MYIGIDPEWRMHQISDGQRRRVQIFLGLIRPFKILLMDEVRIMTSTCVCIHIYGQTVYVYTCCNTYYRIISLLHYTALLYTYYSYIIYNVYICLYR